MLLKRKKAKTSIFVLLLVVGCTSSSKKSSKQTPKKVADQISAVPMMFRRTEARPASAKAKPGGLDYQSSKLPDNRLDCQPLEELFPKNLFDLGEVRECLEEISEEVSVQYKLVRGVLPKLELVPNPEKAPCLGFVLTEIPVPREIFYVVSDGKKLSCYNTGLEWDAEEVLDMKLPVSKLVLKLDFPMEDIPEDDPALLRMIRAWALTPLFRQTKSERFPKPILEGRYVPELLCKQCFGVEKMEEILDSRAPVSAWPR